MATALNFAASPCEAYPPTGGYVAQHARKGGQAPDLQQRPCKGPDLAGAPHNSKVEVLLQPVTLASVAHPPPKRLWWFVERAEDHKILCKVTGTSQAESVPVDDPVAPQSGWPVTPTLHQNGCLITQLNRKPYMFMALHTSQADSEPVEDQVAPQPGWPSLPVSPTLMRASGSGPPPGTA